MTAAFQRRKARIHALADLRRVQSNPVDPFQSAGPEDPAKDRAADRTLSPGLWAILACQFGGAFNDHFFKMLVSLAAIAAGFSEGGGSAYLSLTGMIYVLPFLLFSGLAGNLTDRFDKRLVIIGTKGFEVFLGALALAGLVFANIEFMLVVLFLFAAQSAFFSPPKYGILPEIVAPEFLPRANGMVEFSRYVAIIGGTAMAGILSSTWGRDSSVLGLVIIAVALLGLAASLPIPASDGDLRNAHPRRQSVSGVWSGMKIVCSHPKLRMLVCFTTGVDLAMTLLSLVVLFMAKKTMGLSDLACGLLVALAGVGVAFGSVLAGYLSRGRAEMAFVPLGTVGASCGLIMLSNAAASFSLAAGALAVMGTCAGFVVVPLYTALQRTAAADQRGRIIGANNFFNMFGVFMGSALLWILHDGFGLAPTRVLAVMALVILMATATALGRSSRLRVRLSLLAAVWVECFHQMLIIGLTRMRRVPAGLRPRSGSRGN